MKNTKDTYLSIKHWSDQDKPREKLLARGQKNLSDAELLAILIGSGSKNESAVDLCKRILLDVGNDLSKLSGFSIHRLMEYKGIGEAKAISILAAIELGRRYNASLGGVVNKISSSEQAFQILQPEMGDLAHEEFWVLHLKNNNTLTFKQQISKGAINATLVDVRIILKKALELGSVNLILAHNHPSGNLKPSESDISLTQKIIQAAKTVDINVLDHLIITENDYFSFADEGILNP